MTTFKLVKNKTGHYVEEVQERRARNFGFGRSEMCSEWSRLYGPYKTAQQAGKVRSWHIDTLTRLRKR